MNLAETMKAFREFVLGFKWKYRVAYDRERGARTRAMASPEEGEVLLYEGYLRRMVRGRCACGCRPRSSCFGVVRCDRLRQTHSVRESVVYDREMRVVGTHTSATLT